MRQVTYSNQLFPLIGDTIAEESASEAARNATPLDVLDVIDCLRAAMFGEVMKSLRSTLSLG